MGPLVQVPIEEFNYEVNRPSASLVPEPLADVSVGPTRSHVGTIKVPPPAWDPFGSAGGRGEALAPHGK